MFRVWDLVFDLFNSIICLLYNNKFIVDILKEYLCINYKRLLLEIIIILLVCNIILEYKYDGYY